MSTRRQDYALTKNQLEGRTALVTGASQGIGRATALAFARNSASIVVTARSEDKLRVAVLLASDVSTAITGTAIDAFGATNPLFG